MNKKTKKNIENYIGAGNRFCPCCLKNEEEIFYGPVFEDKEQDCNIVIQPFTCLWCRSVWDEIRKDDILIDVNLRIKGKNS